MPKLFEIMGYKIIIWSNENGEPIHVHVVKGKLYKQATKLWLLSDGTFIIAHNKGRIPKKVLSDIIEILNINSDSVLNFWLTYHGYKKFYQ
ncbi:MAG: hypothetical protein ATN35_12875 [Epulopiscium sp. Nele67-Bin004]|nr:MAG: hypothetical protein ATN35_12875 [Epulopiscium sp. Nele67-Bin004]